MQERYLNGYRLQNMYVLCLERCHHHLLARSFNSYALPSTFFAILSCFYQFWFVGFVDCQRVLTIWFFPFTFEVPRFDVPWIVFLFGFYLLIRGLLHLQSNPSHFFLFISPFVDPSPLVSVGPIAFVRLPLCFILHLYLLFMCTLWIFLLSIKLVLIIVILADCYPPLLKCCLNSSTLTNLCVSVPKEKKNIEPLPQSVIRTLCSLICGLTSRNSIWNHLVLLIWIP